MLRSRFRHLTAWPNIVLEILCCLVTVLLLPVAVVVEGPGGTAEGERR